MKRFLHFVFSLPFIVQVFLTWVMAVILLLLMFYAVAPLLGYIFTVPVKMFNWASLFASNNNIYFAYKSLIWVSYFIPLLYILNLVFTYIIYLYINKEILEEENTFMHFKIALINSFKVLFLQLPFIVLIYGGILLLGVKKDLLVLTPFSTEIIRELIFTIWLVSLTILQISFALKITLKKSLSYAILLFRSYKFFWLFFTIILFVFSIVMARGIIYFVPNFANAGFISNLCLTGFAFAVYIFVSDFVLHYLFTERKPFELEEE